jgi:oligoendopeptidase F
MRWDLSGYFPSFDSTERTTFEEELGRDASSVLLAARGARALDASTAEAWASLVGRWEDLLRRASHLSSYVGCLSAADAEDERFQLAQGRISVLGATLDKISVELRRGLGAAGDETFGAFVARPEIANARYALDRLRLEARTSMAPELEALASDLGTDGLTGWGRLYDVLAAKLSFEIALPDGAKRIVPMAQRRSLMADPDRRVREAAFRGGNAAWEGVSDVAASALNHIAGTRHTLNARRGVGHFLDVALHQASLNQRTLDAMMEAVAQGRDLARRGALLKARAMGLDALSWFDFEAPLPVASGAGSERRLDFDEGVATVKRAFEHGYPALARYLDRVVAARWIDAEPRAKKSPGAFCTHSELTNETRVFMTFQGSLGDVSTLAHEVGHAFHAEVMRDERVLRRQYPMTLAETASTFAESLLSEGLLSDPALSPGERARLLGEVVGDGSAFLLDIPTRFLFEKRFYEERRSGEVPVSQLSKLMVDAQREVFGPALAVGGEDPYFWASKLHFFIPDVTFYNFPYTFGFLLSRGLYAMFKEEGPSFLPRYEAFLRLSGSAMAHEVAKKSVGVDLETPDFWARAIATLEPPTRELERLLPEVSRGARPG